MSAELNAKELQLTTMSSMSNPKVGTLIPNRIFVGGITANTTEEELKLFFSSYGPIKDVKVIIDRTGQSKGSYGFVTFENQETAENIIKHEAETLIFKERKLNIGHAVRKQHLYPRSELSATVLYNGSVPYGLQNGLALFQIPGQDYSFLASQSSPYSAMMLPQANSMFLPSPQFAFQGQSALMPNLSNGPSVAFTQNGQGTGVNGTTAPWCTLAGFAAAHQSSQLSINNTSNSISQTLRWGPTTDSQSPPHSNVASAATYLLNPMAGTLGHEILYIPHNGACTPNSNDYLDNIFEINDHNDNGLIRGGLHYASYNGPDRIIPIGHAISGSGNKIYNNQSSFGQQMYPSPQGQFGQGALAAQFGQIAARMTPACSVLTTSSLSRPLSRGAPGEAMQMFGNHQ